MQENIVKATVGSGAIVEHEGKYLLVQMNYGRYKGHWILPGGMVESGESPMRAAIRECLEETGVEISVSELIAVRYRLLKDREDNVYYVFKGDMVAEDIELKWPEDEILEARLWSFEALMTDPSVRPLTKKYVEMSKMGRGLDFVEAPESQLGDDEVFGLI